VKVRPPEVYTAVVVVLAAQVAAAVWYWKKSAAPLAFVRTRADEVASVAAARVQVTVRPAARVLAPPQIVATD
jgi:hypothetical protein